MALVGPFLTEEQALDHCENGDSDSGALGGCGCAGLLGSLTITVSGCFSGSFVMNWNGSRWVYNVAVVEGAMQLYYADLDPATCYFSVNGHCGAFVQLWGLSGPLTVQSCQPFFAMGTGSFGSATCCTGQTATVIVTE